MAHDAPAASGPSILLIRNIGLLLSGMLEKPILDADTVVAENGKITAIGRAKDVDTSGATTIVDANGTTVAPGLIDSHVHPVAGDWTPRQNQIGWIDSFLHGGVTTMISAGEVHMPGRPRDVVGLKAMAIFAQRAFWTLRPGGVKVHAGAPVIEAEMVEEDFKELAAAGVKLLGEVPAEIAFCFATGNTARMRALDCGLIEVGRAADFVLMDKAQHSAGKNILDSVQLGDLPGVGMTIIDGIVRTQRSRNTPPATKVPTIVGP